MSEMREKITWNGLHRDVGFKIVNWDYEDPTGTMLRHWPSGAWNFYLYLYEQHCADFAALWLPDIVKEWSPGGKKYISHDYYKDPLGQIDLHGGITFYDKHGYTDGFRTVEVGCDYQHYTDEGQLYNNDCVFEDVKAAIASLYDLGIIKQKQ